MSLNEILKYEQITLMRFAATDNLEDARKLRRKLDMFEEILVSHPYPHRAYAPQNPTLALSISGGYVHSAPVLAKQAAGLKPVANGTASNRSVFLSPAPHLAFHLKGKI